MHRTSPTNIFFTSAILALSATSVVAQERHAYFGQTHLHTSWSLDAYIIGNTVTGPEEAYQYAMGQTIKHPAGYDVKIGTPLDFQGVTDHSEYVGVVRLANDPTSSISKAGCREAQGDQRQQRYANLPMAGRQHCHPQAHCRTSRPTACGLGVEAQRRDRRQI